MNGAVSVIEFLVTIAIALIPVGIVLGVVTAIRATNEETEKKKKRLIRRMCIYFAFPFVLLLMIVAVWGLFIFLANRFIL